MKGVWSDGEVKDLFKQVHEFKLAGKPTKDAFLQHAKTYGRKANSVRNYYYHELDSLTSDADRVKRLGIDLSLHKKNQFVGFSEKEKQAIITKIQQKLQEGYSVRKACYLLSGGDVKQMLRLQNKFRANQKNQHSNILFFRKKPANKISESDVNGLFMGVVKLVKKMALDEAKNAVAEEKTQANLAIRKLVAQLGQKDRELEFLKTDYLSLKKENALLKKKVLLATCAKAKSLAESKEKA